MGICGSLMDIFDPKKPNIFDKKQAPSAKRKLKAIKSRRTNLLNIQSAQHIPHLAVAETHIYQHQSTPS